MKKGLSRKLISIFLVVSLFFVFTATAFAATNNQTSDGVESVNSIVGSTVYPDNTQISISGTGKTVGIRAYYNYSNSGNISLAFHKGSDTITISDIPLDGSYHSYSLGLGNYFQSGTWTITASGNLSNLAFASIAVSSN